MRSLDREVRLLTLLPGDGADAIQCTTRVVSLDQHPDFETVSYVWGDRTGEEIINVSGSAVPVTKNLYAGLLRLRNLTTERTLWIDQICINQWDLEEKAAQVALMRDIYKQCTRCVTWMGELTRDGIQVHVQDAEAVFDFLRQSAAAMDVPLKNLPVLFQDSKEGSAAREAFKRFSMYGNPWWSRIWTVQEAIIPPSGVLIWGPLSISRETVLTAARNLRVLDEWPSLPEGFVSGRYNYTALLRRVLYPVHGFNHSKIDDPLNLLMRWRHREFTDPRDKVYALLGLIASDAIPSAQHCDYTIAVPQLFAQVTRDLIEYEGGLRPLLGACEMPHSSTETPSWAIDFAHCNRIGKRQLKWWGHSHRYEVFSACGANRIELVDSFGHETLGLRGVYVDEVLLTTELLRVDAQDQIQFEELRKPLSSCLKSLDEYRASNIASDTYKDGFTWESAFCGTIVGDLIMDELPIGRVELLGRQRLQNDFIDLFEKLQIPLSKSIDMDFVASSAHTSPTYSPTSPAWPNSPDYTSKHPAYSASSPLSRKSACSHYSISPPYSPASVQLEEAATSTTAQKSTIEPYVTGIASSSQEKREVQISNSSDVFESGDESGSQLSYTSERLFHRKRSSKRYDHKKGVSSNGLSRSREDLGPVDEQSTSRARSSPEVSDYIIGGRAVEARQAIDRRRQRPNKLLLQNRRIDLMESTSKKRRDWHQIRPDHDVFTELYESLIGMMENQTFFITKSGYIGIGPAHMRAGDQVWIFNGGNVPFVMRRAGEEKQNCPQLVLIGDAYVHGIMDGEVMDGETHVQTVYIR